MHKMTTMLWFDSDAEAAAQFYVSIFPNSRLGAVSRYSEGAAKMSGRPAGSVMTASFILDGREFTALNGGPLFKFNESISLVVHCDSQAEIDTMWAKLSAGGTPSRCGWLKDRFGLSWQVVPTDLPKLLQGTPEQSQRVGAAIMQMDKLDVRKLQQAFDGK